MSKRISYKKILNKLEDQISRELGWAEEDTSMSAKEKWSMIFAYKSILSALNSYKNEEENIVKEAKDLERRKTIIVAPNGRKCVGYRVCAGDCLGCPYLVEDINHNDACYKQEYFMCKNDREVEDEEV